MSEPLLRLEDLKTHFYTDEAVVRAVDGVSYEVNAGETLAVVGESGSGKSVTALSILRLVPEPPGRIVGGRILFKGRNLLDLSEAEMRVIRGNEISMIFQEPMTALNPVFTCGEQIIETIVLHDRVDRTRARKRAIEMLELVGIPAARQRVDEYPHQLSGGMRQRVMIAMALACRPSILIADEPTTALDVTIQAQILELLKRLQAELGMAVILITHDLGVVAETADRVAVMYAGQVVEYTDVRSAFRRPLHPYTAGLQASLPKLGVRQDRLRVIPGNVPNPARFPAGCRFHPRCPVMLPSLCLEPPNLVAVETSHQSRCVRADEIAAGQLESGQSANGECVMGSGPLLEVRDLKKYFPIRKGLFSKTVGHVKAVDGVSFDIQPGEVLGLVGESGCGKTTTGRAILRLIEPTSGSVKLEGREIVGLPRRELRALRREMQIIFQDPYSSLNPRLTIGSMLREALTTHGLARGAAARDRVAELLSLVGLSPAHATRYPHEFSGGQRQRIGVARALAVSPKLIVADEPVSALDLSIQAQIINLLRDLQQQMGLTYLFVAHDLSVVEHISNRVAVMYLGGIVELASSEALYRHPYHPYTVSLLSAIPVPDPDQRRRRIVLGGDVPSPANPPSGCRFHPRCYMAEAICGTDAPPLREVAPGQFSACHFAEHAVERALTAERTGERTTSEVRSTTYNVQDKKT